MVVDPAGDFCGKDGCLKLRREGIVEAYIIAVAVAGGGRGSCVITAVAAGVVVGTAV